MSAAKRRPTLRALMIGIAGMAALMAAPRLSPALAIAAQLGATLLAGLAIALYVPAHRIVGGMALDEAMMVGLVLVVAIGTVGPSRGGSRCGAVVAPGALSAAVGQGGLPNLSCAADPPADAAIPVPPRPVLLPR